MATKIVIINRALIKLGAEPLMSETDSNAQSRAIEAVYDGVLDNLLRNYRWAFAIKRAQLGQLTDVPVYGYQYQYEVPADCVRIDAISDYPRQEWHHGYQLPIPRYQIEGKAVLTNTEPPLYMRYVSNGFDPSQFDPSFVEALACALALEICEKVTQSSTKKQTAQRDLQQAITQARQVSAIERPPIQQQETSWFTSRL